MKKLLLLFLFISIFGCNEPDKKPDGIVPSRHGELHYEIVIIDGCEYISGWMGGGYGGPYLTHKGNCKNPIHSINKTTVIDTVRYKLVRE